MAGRQQRWKRGALRARPRGVGQRPPYAAPHRRPCLSLAPTRQHRTRPARRRLRNACDFHLAPPLRAPQGGQPLRPLPSPAAEFSLLPLGQGMRRAPAPRRRRGAMRGEHGTFSLCPSEAVSLTPLRAVLPARLRWVPASAAAPQASGRRTQPFSREAPAPHRAAPCCRTERRGARSGEGRGGLAGGGSSRETPCFRTEM